MHNIIPEKLLLDKELNNLSKYIEEVNKVKPLSNVEEIELAKLIKDGDQFALEKLVKANLRFVISVAKQYQNNGLTLPNLIKEGNFGLIKAAKQYNSKKGFSFISYAVWWIRQSINEALPSTKKILKNRESISTIKKGMGENFSEVKQQKNDTTWTIDLKISNNDDSKSIYSLWLLLEALKSIDGLVYKIEELSKGSIIAKIKVLFKSDEAKKEAEELLESTKKLVKGKLEHDYYENEKNISESKKFNLEKEKLQNEINLTNSIEQKKRRKLEIEALEIENENKKLQNERLKLQIFIEKKQALAELLSVGIINSDDYKLAINGALQIHKKNDNSIEIGI